MPIAKYYERLATVQARGNQVTILFCSFLLMFLVDNFLNFIH